MNISNLITNNASMNPNGKAFIYGDDGREFTWLEIDKNINQLGNALVDIGVKKGDVVAIYLPNSPEFIITYFAAAKIGAIVVPFNILFKTGEISYIVNNCRARILVGSSIEVEKYIMSERGLFPYLEEIITVGSPVKGSVDFYSIMSEASERLKPVNCTCEDLVSLVYTSGTTGHPKGAMLSYNNLSYMGFLTFKLLHINDQDLVLAGPPFCHIAFVESVLGPLLVGAGIVTLSRFNAEKNLELISHYKITHLIGVPTMYIYMLQAYDGKKHDLSSLRLLLSSGGPMPVEYIQEIEEKFGGCFCEQYGTTENSSIITSNRMGHRRIGSVGTAAYGISIKVVDPSGNQLPAGEIGEIMVKGPGNFKGYWEMPEATREVFDGEWYHTGDLGKFDADGYFYIIDRLKDMIVSCGYNVYPRELEDIIYQHPKVMEAAVMGIEDDLRQEVPIAFVRLRENQEMTEQELIDYCIQKMAYYKVPRIIKFVDELPKGPTGKILKRECSRLIG